MSQVNLSPGYDGHIQTYRNLSLGTGSNSVKQGETQLFGILGFNSGSAENYVKIYNVSGTVDPNVHTPVLTFPIAAASNIGEQFIYGIPLNSGLNVRASTLIADTASGNPATNSVVVNLLYV